MTHELLKLSTATGRWSGVGPYYAMFPREFAFDVVEQYSETGQYILDPFAGRATSIYAAAALQRYGYGIEINPVGWLYGRVKLDPAPKDRVLSRNNKLGEIANNILKDELTTLPEFFFSCYTEEVLRYLVAARKVLSWRRSPTDATIMAIILVHLHGKRETSFSNQMRQGKAMHPDYSIRWWQERNMLPPDINPVEFMEKRIDWRYAKGMPKLENSKVIFGDSTLKLREIIKMVLSGETQPFNLLFTSPPYYGITNYYYDQWLRLWMLGGNDRPTWTGEKWKGKFESKEDYHSLLSIIFQKCAEVMANDAIVYVRTDARPFTLETTKKVLARIFPNKSMEMLARPFEKETQTALYGDKAVKPGEVDIIMYPYCFGNEKESIG
ncbi:DNA methyltransferase [Pseudanabaena sp. PCC 6802]|uniref:DNA methyltransferase n=1 Tax=Pseudanabaena sp. PCC 6802 TaxID=118173 RepID=UPI00034AD998|nr:DNA methyltransferase [Pseudanabaena sp. PCC 6802]